MNGIKGSHTTIGGAGGKARGGLEWAVVGALLVAAVPAGAQTVPAVGSVLEEITVTARKKDETALTVPVSITAFSEANLERLDIASFTDYATKTPNMTFSYGTANYGYVDSHSIAIRGVSGVGTTGFYIDDTPIPDSLDPRVVDIARIEVLKGPQGTLFGQSSLGGNVRLITVAPTLGVDDVHASARLGGTSGAGSADYGFNVAGSHTLIDDTLVARAVVFYNHDSGFMREHAVDPNTGAVLEDRGNVGALRSFGGSLAVRWFAGERFEALFRIMAQQSESAGWTAPYASLPGFSVDSLTMDRTNPVGEAARDRFYLPSLQLTYKGGGYSVVESLSYFDRRATQIEDGSEGTRYALSGDWAGAASVANPNLYPYAGIDSMASDNTAWPWYEIVSARRTTSETRLSFDKTSFGLSGVAGVYLSRSFSDTYINSGSSPLIRALGLNTDAAVTDANNYFYGVTTPQSYCRTFVGDHSCATYGTGLGWESWAPSYHRDGAVFGELYWEVGKAELTAGGRYYHQTQSGSQFEAGALNFSELNIRVPDTEQQGFDPKLALRYKFTPGFMAYGSFSKGFRSGGAGVPLPIGPASFFTAINQKVNEPTTYSSDFVKNYEIGAKLELAGGALVMTGALFQMDWSNIQQTIVAPVSQITLVVNAGDARIRGGEFEVDAKPADFVDLHAGVGYEDAVITHGVLYWQPSGSPVYNTPKLTANANATFRVPVGDELTGFLTVDGGYTGPSYSGTAACQLNVGPGTLAEYPSGYQFFPCPQESPTNLAGSAPRRAGFSTLNARLGLTRGKAEFALYGNNLTNARPNLGDFNPSSYPNHDAATGYLLPRVATLRPLSAGIEFRERF